MRRRGFSLLEVMVAIAILGLTLTVILSAQGGLAASNRSAANMGQASAMARCKMTEIEENLLKLGYPLLDQIDTEVACCDGEKSEVFTCDVKVEKIELPNFQSGNSLGDGGALVGPGASASPLGTNAAGGPGLDLNVDGGLQALGTQVAGQFGAGGSGAQGLVSMVMGIVYPAMKPMYEASIRRVSVTVRWKEGPNARELPIVQYLTRPQQSGFASGVTGADGGALDFAPPTTGAGADPTRPSTSGPSVPGLNTGAGKGF